MKAAVVQPLPGIGDMIWHLPHIRAIAAHVGEPVTLLAKPRSAADQIFGAETTVRDVMWLDRNPENRRGEHDGGGGFLRVARALRARQFAAVYLLHHSRTIAAQLMAAGIPARFGYGVGTQRLFLNRRPFLTPAEARHHPFEQATAWLAAAGIPMDQAEPVLPAAASARDAVRARLGAGGAALVTIGIGSSEPYKQWGAVRFAALANGLMTMGFQHLVLVGGNAERALAEEIRALVNPAISLAIGWNLGDIAALFAESLFYVGNDTGVMNMAAAVGIPAYCLFGATPPFFHSSRIVTVTPPGGVDRAEGMARITPDAVLRAIAAGVITAPDAGRSTPPPAAGPH